MDKSYFFEGRMFDAYEYLGAHPTEKGVYFCTYAPNAQKVAVVGSFNDWYPHQLFCEDGFWSGEVEGAKVGDLYKYVIYTRSGEQVQHSDPYGFGMELRPQWASVVRDLNEYKFTDGEWLSKRDKNYNKPLNIYEMHAGSWKKKGEGETDWYTYDELAEILIPYLKEHGYTHVEFMPLSEHPADISWGYQNTGFYAPTSRYGTAAQLMELIDKLHNAGIGAIMDFVPVHFALDDYALRNFDGTPLYEYPDSDVAISEWGTCNFLFNKAASAVFMQSCANYWLEKYHFDGLRMDAISRAIYWMGDPARGVNPNSVDFLRRMNGALQNMHPDCMLIAEDSTAFPKITAPVEYGGLGFDYKWDLGWMNDTLNYFRTPPIMRKGNHHLITFSMAYFYNELYLLELSHDENVHGKATVVQKMWGEYEDKFPQARAMYTYMYTHPGKKLNFMGGEYAQFREWDETKEQDWFMLKYPLHESFDRYMKKLGELYRTLPALHNGEYDRRTFRWLMADNSDQNFFVYLRCAEGQTVLCAFNFSGSEQTVRINASEPWVLTPLLHSDEETYSGTVKHEDIVPIETHKDIDGEVFNLTLPKFSAELFEVTNQTPNK
ncbi:1,4-alpha-glucan branching enzyme [Ruminococcus sp. YE71]|uniref:1,4-alpha-glucan branching protein GlgB n=1 Tax=unclassified Ruminococcus TaxID=2608920 RepID=UPI00087EBCC0|nr:MULTISPECIES: 1,4-alpha-glucan branching protein GlgB [unclassified Ruminococcus]SDA17519.1 1,4-alpha-glucan branching enzyme [Ruminococcus sp. YE78]SFW26960.1 1,4-alpha-glucan branching enzyme [Ruminococcus sp. YE71]